MHALPRECAAICAAPRRVRLLERRTPLDATACNSHAAGAISAVTVPQHLDLLRAGGQGGALSLARKGLLLRHACLVMAPEPSANARQLHSVRKLLA